MKAEKMNLINSLTLVVIGIWGYIDVSNYNFAEIISFEHWTALIPVIFGVILLLCTNGIRNSNKLIAHLAVLLTLLIFIALVAVRLPKSIVKGDIGILRVIVMSLTSFLAFIAFIRSFIENRRNSA